MFAHIRLTPLLKTALGSLGLKIAAAGVGLLNGVLLARLLGPAEFGVYSIAMAAATLLGTVAALGLPTLVTREVAVHNAQENWPLLKGLLATSQLWVLLASLFFVLVGGALVFLDKLPSTVTIIGWVSVLVLIPLVALNQLRAAILRGLHWVITADVPDLLLRPLAMLILLGGTYVFAKKIDADSALLIQMVAVLLALGFGSWSLDRRLPKVLRQTKAETTHLHWFRSSGIFLAITMLGLLEGQVPLYFVGHLAGAQQAGLYQAAIQLVTLIAIGLVAINMSLQPRLAASWARGDIQHVQQFITETARMGTGIALAGMLVIMVFAEVILRIYGAQFAEAAHALRILAVGQMVNAAAGSCGILLMMTGHQRVVMQGTALAVLLNVIICYLAVPEYGAMGGAMATMLGMILWNVLFSAYAKIKLGLNTTILGRYRF